MAEQSGSVGPLAPYRVLDLTDEKGYLCGKHLADLGADVIKIEKPGGDPGRRIGPFYHGIPDPEKSLYWFAYNNNKRSITLNLETADGRYIFKWLVKSADFVIESFPPGYMDQLGLGYSVLNQNNPRIIVTSITPFGQAGPYSHYKASDIVIMAMGGLMYITGDPDRPPVRISFPQAWLLAGLEAAVGTLMAHYYRETTGEGQHVDVSAQSAVITFLEGQYCFWEFGGRILRREGPFSSVRSVKASKTRALYQCRDGYVAFPLYGGAVGARTNQSLVAWMSEEGLEVEGFKETDWSAYDMRKVTQEDCDFLAKTFSRFFERHTKAEFYQGALERDLMGYPVSTVKDLVEDPQLAARNFWVEVSHPELGVAISYPGEFAKLSEATCSLRRRAPFIGEHNQEIYCGELGLSKEDLVVLKQSGVI